MLFYPLKKIGALAQSRQIYLRGVHGYNAGWVRRFTEGKNAFYPDYIAADTDDGSTVCHVEVGFDETGEAEYLECSCGAVHPGDGACRHIVAVLAHKYYQDMVRQLPTAASLLHRPEQRGTDPAARRLIDQYMTDLSARLTAPAAEQDGQAVLTPILSLRAGYPVLSFTVGITRPYVVKSLPRFADSMSRGETVEYGRQLRLVHRTESFAPESRPLLQFLLDECDEHGSFSGAPGELPLTAAAFDRFYAAAEGGTVLLREAAGDCPLSLQTADPILSVTAAKEPGGIRLYGEDAEAVFGRRTLYVLQQRVLYRTGDRFSRRMTEWVRTMRRQEGGLFIAAAELPAFCAGVLAAVRPYIRLDGDTEALKPYQPRRLQAEIYLDAPEEQAITGRVLYRYRSEEGETVIEPFADAGADAAGQPWRDPLGELRVRTAVQRQFTLLRPESGLLVLRGDDARLFAFVTQGVEELRQVAAVYTTDAFDRLMPGSAPMLHIGVSLVSDLLQMEVEADGAQPLDLTGIITGYREKRPFHRLKNGRFVRLDDNALAGLAELADTLGISGQELSSGHIALPKYRALYLEQVLREHADAAVQRDQRLQGLLERFDRAAGTAWTIPAGLQGVLRPYQEAGYRWLRTMEALGFGGVLADDMGLGKTVQVIALLAARKNEVPEEGRLPSLVVCPTSLVLGWEREIRRFAPELTVTCVTGDAAARQQQLETADSDVLITSYDRLKRDVALYASRCFHYQILDEAQYIKNSTTQNARAVKAVQAVQRFALTGTPVENRLSELWSIFDFLMPGMLFSYAKFRTRFETPIVRQGDSRALERLGKMVSPFILRRLKRDVLTELPPKTERILPAEMESAQRTVYLSALQTLRQQLEEGRRGTLSGQSRMAVLAMLTRLRQICCDPRLCCEGYTGQSCKLEACIELLKEAAEGGHKVLLFSQFTSMLSLLGERLQAEGIRYYILTGATAEQQRAALVDAFNADDTPVFMISLKAGGTGLNLTGADMVIHYDPWWNLAAQNQATDRAHRIGQQNPVQVVRLIVRGTVEEKILRMQEEKWRLAQSVVESGGADIAALSAEELLELLGG